MNGVTYGNRTTATIGYDSYGNHTRTFT
jgi:hypothetical protein